mgnify:CR=1 FL=1
MMQNIDWNAFIIPIVLSLKISIVASIVVFVLGLIAAWFMVHKRFKGRIVIETLFMLPLVLPPTVVGFALLVVLGRKSWLGRTLEALFQQPIVFTWQAGVIASVIVSFPLVYQFIKVGFLSVDKDMEDASRSMGATEWQVLRFISIPLAWRSLVSGFVLGFARSLGEFGATLMIAGNIPGKTQTVPTAIYIAVDSGRVDLAWYWVISIVLTSFFMLIIVSKQKKEEV